MLVAVGAAGALLVTRRITDPIREMTAASRVMPAATTRSAINAVIGYTELLDLGISGTVTDEHRNSRGQARGEGSRFTVWPPAPTPDRAPAPDDARAGRAPVAGRSEPASK